MTKTESYCIIILITVTDLVSTMKYSKQREYICNAVKASHMHPSADDVFEAVRRDMPNISLGTVYRNLNLLVENGVIKKISMPDSCDRFDGRCDEHCHAVCVRCGKILDVEIDPAGIVGSVLKQQNSFIVNECQLVIKGICKTCIGQQEDSNVRELD